MRARRSGCISARWPATGIRFPKRRHLPSLPRWTSEGAESSGAACLGLHYDVLTMVEGDGEAVGERAPEQGFVAYRGDENRKRTQGAEADFGHVVRSNYTRAISQRPAQDPIGQVTGGDQVGRYE